MTEQPDETEEKSVRRTVRVPTTRCAAGEFADYIDADPAAAWQWDARRWERIA